MLLSLLLLLVAIYCPAFKWFNHIYISIHNNVATTLSKMTLSTMTFIIKTLSITKFSITTLNIMTLSVIIKNATLSIMTQYKGTLYCYAECALCCHLYGLSRFYGYAACHHAECHYTGCHYAQFRGALTLQTFPWPLAEQQFSA